MWSPCRKKENGIKNHPFISCKSHKPRWRISDHLRCIASENEVRPKHDDLHSYNFYFLIILMVLMITSPLPAAFAESEESGGGGGGGDDDNGGGGDDDNGGGGDDDNGGGGDEQYDSKVEGEDGEEDMKEVDNAQKSDDPTVQEPTSFGTTAVARPGDQSLFGTTVDTGGVVGPPVDTGGVVGPPVDTGGVVGPPVDTGLTQLNEDSEPISNMKKDVEKAEEILSLEDEKFVDGIINYAKEHVKNDIDEESKLLLTALTPDETKALVRAQIHLLDTIHQIWEQVLLYRLAQ
jgi:hypothetical protein